MEIKQEVKKKLKLVGIIAVILTTVFIILIGIANKFNKTVDKENHTNPNEDIEVNDTEYEAKSREIASFIVNKDYESIYKEFSRDLKKQLTIERFTEESNSILSSAGKFEKYADIITNENEDYVSAKAFLKYKKKGICINLFLDLSGDIDGIRLDYCTVPTFTKNYTEQYVAVGKYSLHGLLTLPKDVEKPPVVILIADSGNIDMDSTIYSNKPFANIAHGLAKKGIATLRFNKRYNQYSKLASNSYSIKDDILEDANSAIELMMKDKRIDNNNIFIIGHGLGGSLTPKIAKDNPKVRGIISLAGSPRHYADVIYDQYVCEIGASNLKDNDKLQEINQTEKDVEKIKSLKKGGVGLILGYSKTYWKSLNNIDIENIVTQIDTPMLFLQGKDDFQIYSAVDFSKWKEILKDKKNCSFIEYKGLNHYFIKSNGKDITEAADEYKIKGKVNSDVINDIAKWIEKYITEEDYEQEK